MFTANPPIPQTGNPPIVDSPRRSPAVSPYLRKRIRYRDACIDHYLVSGGQLRRFVVLTTARLRELLGQPRRREIEPFTPRQAQFELLTSEMCELAWPEAKRILRGIYRRARQIELERSHAEAQEPLEAGATTKRGTARVPGKPLTPQPAHAEVRGVLLRAGIGEFDLYDEDAGEVRRISGIEPLLALQAAGAQPYDLVRVIPTGEQEVSIREHRSGTHGDGQRTLRRVRKTYQVLREVPAHPRERFGKSTPAPDPGAVPHGRPQPSLHSGDPTS